MMIAIGILGIGMLMVAATFPVGIQQTQIAVHDTMAPIVADDAWGALQMKLDQRGLLTYGTLRDALPKTASPLSSNPKLRLARGHSGVGR